LLDGDTPRLLDEWQTAPVLWDAVRYAVDNRGEKGQFILTGSAVPTDNATMHTGTGRISRFKMRTMTLWESKESNGQISLGNLFNGVYNTNDIDARSNITIEQLAFLICRGGWPASIGENENAALKSVYEYVKAVTNEDVSKVDGVEKDPERVRAILRSLARNISSPTPNTTIAEDVQAQAVSITEKTLAIYLNALRRINVIEDLPSWNPKLRSKTAIRTFPKRHFVDPSIAVAALNATPDALLHDFNTFGLLFESLCIRDLRVYAEAIDGTVFHYRDKSGLEADAILKLNDGRWAAVEVKMGESEIESAAKNLLKLKDNINTLPSFLMILTATEYCYKRTDGIFIVPIGCLKD
jgi:predicted AAA+ superfamily ATPase